ncbi:MAG: PEP-CTERM sorting domain-containing protein [Verrucomicrobia bacterium]|nr:MAG: PEP-CTERM sorting domain-containing protein [Verrucomicrobiota bacterium]
MKTPILAVPAAFFVTLAALPLPRGLGQIVLTQWDFNSVPPDTTTTTGSLVPRTGIGSVTGFGGVSAGFSDATGSSDPAKKDNTGLNLSTFAPQGTGNGSRGVLFRVPTLGHQDISVSWDQRFSGTAARGYQFQYTLDGSSFVPYATFSNSAGGNAWVPGNSVELGQIPGVADNPDFGFRIVAVFDPGTTAYGASGVGSTYGTSGTWRFDEVTVRGTAMPTVIPEPHEYALMAAGSLAGFAWWRRHSRREGGGTSPGAGHGTHGRGRA